MLPLVAELSGADVVGGLARLELGQLAGRLQSRFAEGNDGTPDRALATWVVSAAAGTEISDRCQSSSCRKPQHYGVIEVANVVKWR